MTEWSAGENVLWRADMPDWSNSQPVVAGDFVYTCSEPTTLLCVRRSDGKVLWQRTHDYVDLLPPEKREEVLKELVGAERLRKAKLDPLKKRLQEVNRELQRLPKDPFLTRQKGSLQREVQKLQEKLAALEEYRPPRADPVLGHSNCTPVADGQGVFALFGNGVGAVYDLEGRQKWLRAIRRPKMPLGFSMSPVLAGEALVMSMDKEILAVDSRTGKDLWTVSTYRPSAGLAAAKVGPVPVVATAEGSVIRASDGRMMARVEQTATTALCAPMVHEGVLYLLGANQRLLMELLLPDGADGVKLESVAAGQAFLGTHYGSPLYHNGCVYFWDKGHVLSVVSAKSGRTIRTKRLGLSGTAYASPTLGGKHIFLGTDDGAIAVIEPVITPAPGGKLSLDLKEVAVNRLDATRSSPVFAGKCMFLRTLKYLYCIGPKEGGPDGPPGKDDNPFRLGVYSPAGGR
ncbi:MAG TPA: PQQ-binding-like beta-propeller repeat protein [Phycisphaerae bacterium]|nr:PQQ-binding-like beta-propeller repeat protein [Phycisphaerae bacterium]